MRMYALNDTRHLRALELQLKHELVQTGRLEWAEESCRKLIEETSREKPLDVANAWRMKGSDRLTPRAAAVLRELWHWREAEALHASRPPYFILSHESLVDLAARVSHKGQGTGLIPPRIVGRRRSTLEQAIQRALAIPVSDFPQPPRRSDVRLTGREQARMAELRTIRDGRAQDLNLDPALIASRADLVALARNEKSGLSSLMEWQARLLGLA
jgi:ribonuclease D